MKALWVEWRPPKNGFMPEDRTWYIVRFDGRNKAMEKVIELPSDVMEGASWSAWRLLKVEAAEGGYELVPLPEELRAFVVGAKEGRYVYVKGE